jgi:hypothetical protein
VGKTERGMGAKVMGGTDRTGLPLATHIAAASPPKITLVEPMLATCAFDAGPEHLIGDKAHDSYLLAECLADEGIETIPPHRANLIAPRTQDCRPLTV